MTTAKEQPASERTVPDTTLDEEAKQAARERAQAALAELQAEQAQAEQATATQAKTEQVQAKQAQAETARLDGRAQAGRQGEGEGAIEIPAPHIQALAPRRGLDSITLIAMLSFVLVGGLLVFGFAQALVPAAEAQLGAACRPLTPVTKGIALPALELEDLAGQPASLDDFRGKFVVLNFWATWCDPCTREWPDLDLLATRLAERDDIAIVAISVDQSVDDIIPYLQRMGLSDTRVKILRAKDPKAHELLGSTKIPDTYFVSAKGVVEMVFINVRDWGRPKAIRCVEASALRGE